MTKAAYTLITGASSGIGKELARIAARDGRNVVLVARNKTTLNAYANELRSHTTATIETFTCDLSLATSPEKLFKDVSARGIHIDTLINNAGVGDYGAFQAADRDTQLAMINLNIRTVTELTHLFLPDILKQPKGYIMNLGSVASFLPGPLMSVYFASKAYVLNFSEALSEELRGTSVSVTCLCPGSTKTGFGETAHVSQTHSTRTSRVTPSQVAAFGWKAMLAGKPVAVHGLSNRLAVMFIKFLPRRIVARIVKRIQT